MNKSNILYRMCLNQTPIEDYSNPSPKKENWPVGYNLASPTVDHSTRENSFMRSSVDSFKKEKKSTVSFQKITLCSMFSENTSTYIQPSQTPNNESNGRQFTYPTGGSSKNFFNCDNSKTSCVKNLFPEKSKKCSKKNINDFAFIIDIDAVAGGEERRKTIMIKNIPNKYSLKTLREDLDKKYGGMYDVFYLPIDYKNKCNLGYAFINFVHPFYLLSFYEEYQGLKWTRYQSSLKTCELAYAKIQGRDELVSHYAKGTTMNAISDAVKPLIIPSPKVLPKIEVPIRFLSVFTSAFSTVEYSITEQKESFIIQNFFYY